MKKLALVLLAMLTASCALAANDYYVHDTERVTQGSRMKSSQINTIGDNIEDGFDKLPTEAEIGVLKSVTPGTVAASKAVVVDASKRISELTVLGNTALDGGLTIDTNKFTVAGNNTGNTSIGGTLAVTGTLTVGSGKIAFPATQAASTNANTLDDYEEGTFTPTVVSSGGGSGTYSIQTGQYIKIGRLVNFYVGIALSGHSGSGTMNIEGLPFTATLGATSVCAVRTSGLGADNARIHAVVSPYDTKISLANLDNTAVDLDTSFDISVNGTYFSFE